MDAVGLLLEQILIEMPAQGRRGERLVTVLALLVLDRRILRWGLLPLGIVTSYRTLGRVGCAGGVVGVVHCEAAELDDGRSYRGLPTIRAAR